MREQEPLKRKPELESDLGFTRLVEHIQNFYRANPGALLRPCDLITIVGGREPEIHAACEYLRGEGVLAERPRITYRLRQ